MINFIRHDVNASSDPKLVKVRMKLGYEGQGLYWSIIEMMAQNEGQLEADYNMLGYLLRTSAEVIKKLICDFGLFAFTDNNKNFFSIRLNSELEDINDKSQKAKEKAEKRWSKVKNDTVEKQEKSKGNTTAMLQHCNSNADNIIQDKIRKDNNIIPPLPPKGESVENQPKNIFSIEAFIPEEKSSKESEPAKRFIKPSVSEIDDYAKTYLKEKGYLVSFNPESFFDFYESKGWFVGKNKMKDWKAAVRNWINSDNKSSKSSKKADFSNYDLTKNPFDF